MSHECWRYASNSSLERVPFTCSCGCCGGPYTRYCCDPTYCDPTGGRGGYYLSEAAVISLLCLGTLVLIGTFVALFLACRMRQRPFKKQPLDEKSQHVYDNQTDCPPSYYYHTGIHDQQRHERHQQTRLQMQQREQRQIHTSQQTRLQMQQREQRQIHTSSC